MKHNIETIFEHAIDLAHERFNYSSRHEVEYGLIENLKQAAISTRIDDYMKEEHIIYAMTCIWGIDWVPLENYDHTKCDCGAKHTSFPEHHAHYCTVLNPDQIEWITMKVADEEGFII